MPNFTKQAIKASFWKLLNQQPLSQISVRTIVEDCGINRNSFYYHFQDIPSMIEEMIMDEANALIEKYPNINSVDEMVETAFRFTQENKRAIAHICNSVKRNIYEQYLMRICEHVVRSYFETTFKDEKINPSDLETIVLFTKCELFGLFVDWVNSGMPDSAMNKLKELISLCDGLAADMVSRIKIDSSN